MFGEVVLELLLRYRSLAFAALHNFPFLKDEYRRQPIHLVALDQRRVRVGLDLHDLNKGKSRTPKKKAMTTVTHIRQFAH